MSTLIIIFALKFNVYFNIMEPMKYEFDFGTQYNTFYLSSDEGMRSVAEKLDNSDQSLRERLVEAKNLLAISTHSYGRIRGTIHFLDSVDDNINLDLYDHIVEVGLKVESGELQVLSCPTSSIEFKKSIDPGTYRVRIYSSGLKSYDTDEEEGDDRYKIEIWPDTNKARKVLKQYDGY